jgi:hypothetical protein
MRRLFTPFCGLLGPQNGVRSEFPDSLRRDYLENSWTDRMERFLVAQSVSKEAFHPVARAHGLAKWSLFRVSRQSLYALG